MSGKGFWRKALLVGGTVLGALAAGDDAAAAGKTLRAVMHSDLKILDPIWTTAYITRNHAYMVYDTLFALDEKLEPKPQMVDSWAVSDDRLAYRFRLRDGLVFHDGAPVTSDDAIASIRRWGPRDAMGQKLMAAIADMTPNGPRSFTIRLKEPYGLVLASLAKPSSLAPFVMPKRIAQTPGSEQIAEHVGSGPFVFEREAWKPGAVAVYERFEGYRPRAEPPSGLAGGKVARVDRVEWVWIPDPQTAANALARGEVDLVEAPPHDLLPMLEADPNLVVANTNPLGYQFTFRFNFLHPPFDDPKARQAALASLNQRDFLEGLIGNPRYYRECAAMFVCGTTYASADGGEILLKSDFERSRRLLVQAGYDGTPIVLMQPTDVAVIAHAAPIAKQLLEQGGFKVDMQAMDWQTLVSRRAKKEPPAQGGWNAFPSWGLAVDLFSPLSSLLVNTACDKAWFGWPCDAEIEASKDRFARATELAEQKALAAEIQKKALEFGTHAYLGQWYQPMAWRKELSGVIEAPVPVFWNIEKKG